MQIGVIFPQTEYGIDPEAIRDYSQTAESLGYTHILAYEHVLGANPERPGGWMGPYTYQHAFLEPFLLFSYMAAHTKNIGFTTGVIIMPQRETALVAKQTATLDVLSKGRLRLGIGIGWNPVEYTVLNQDFHTRGRRVEEQVELLRLLWTQPLVKYSGRWHDVPDAGINPLPIQRPIPIWFGGHAEVVLRRIARMGLEARLHYGNGEPSDWDSTISGWQRAGATHLTLNTMGSGFNTPSDHLRAIEIFAKERGLV
jgi:probable F420-dependent oxidoreductase